MSLLFTYAYEASCRLQPPLSLNRLFWKTAQAFVAGYAGHQTRQLFMFRPCLILRTLPYYHLRAIVFAVRLPCISSVRIRILVAYNITTPNELERLYLEESARAAISLAQCVTEAEFSCYSATRITGSPSFSISYVTRLAKQMARCRNCNSSLNELGVRNSSMRFPTIMQIHAFLYL